MNRAQVIDLLADVGGLDQVVDVAERLVDELESRRLLRLGDARRWRVELDDPDATRPYAFDDIEASTAAGAAIEAARRVIRADPRACLSGGPVKVSPEDRAMLADGAADSNLIQAVARWATVSEIGGAS